MTEDTHMPVSKTPGEQTTQTLAYWMGKVDSKLTELSGLIEKFASTQDHANELSVEWRRQVDARLVKGTENFAEINRRLKDLEQTRCPLGAACPAINHLQGKDQPAAPPPEKKAFGSWEWFRENYLEKVATALFAALFFALILLIIQHEIPIR